jgi:FlaA1/EpsC-like NDP-sugar epimerase
MSEPEKASTQIPTQTQDVQPGLESELKGQKPIVIRDTYKGSGKLEGKVAIITGGDSGIGRSVAVHFAREGADVAILYLEEETKDAQETEELVKKEGRKCLLFAGDVSNPTVSNWPVFLSSIREAWQAPVRLASSAPSR